MVKDRLWSTGGTVRDVMVEAGSRIGQDASLEFELRFATARDAESYRQMCYNAVSKLARKIRRAREENPDEIQRLSMMRGVTISREREVLTLRCKTARVGRVKPMEV